MRLKAISCRVEPKTHKRFTELAALIGASTADLVRDAIDYGKAQVEQDVQEKLRKRTRASYGLRS